MFEQAMEFLLRPDIEGIYSNDPSDPGGETKYGISKRSYPNVDIANLTKEGAAEIYKRDYWNICHCDKLPANVAPLVFDMAVNQGTDTAIRNLQLSIGVQVDGVIGPMTIMTAEAQKATLGMEYTVRRLVRYGNSKNYNVYGLGWVRRAMKCYEASKP